MSALPPIPKDSKVSSFTSDTTKFYWHRDVMLALQKGEGKPIVTHVMPTDVCDKTCGFCSVQRREGDALTLNQVRIYLEQLVPLGLKAVILSGGGNPILAKCRETGAGFNEYVDMIHGIGLQIGLITNGLKMKKYPCGRTSWLTVKPETLDKCTWIRISMAGLDHEEREVFVPDVDPSKTTLGFSYVYHDLYKEPADKWHGKVSTPEDLITPLVEGDGRVTYASDRKEWLTEKIKSYVEKHSPVYCRLLPNCLEPQKIDARCVELQDMANQINPKVAFVQWKPPSAPNKCFLGYIHPVLLPSGNVAPCDSCCLNKAAGHSFANPYFIARWDTIGELYAKPVHSLIDPKVWCEGCVFSRSNEILEAVVDGIEIPIVENEPFHSAFV